MKSLHNYIIPVLALALAACSQSGSQTDDIEKKIDHLLSQMTLEEKIGQLHQITSMGTLEDMCAQAKDGTIGSILNEIDPERINQIQCAAVEESRLGIPLLIARDVIHGYKTMFPIPLGQAATFDPAIVEEGARVSAAEASADGIRWTFSPMLDVARDPRWGRIAEGSGEDPYLTSVMGAAMVKGYQGTDLSNPASIAACAKHFVGYGAAEAGKDYNSTNIPMGQMRNVYLPPFLAAKEAGMQTFMSSFNDNDGIPATGNRWLLTDLLRDEWGFDGFVVTDWNSAGEMLNHGFCADMAEVAEKSMNAGIDMDMMAFAYTSQLADLLKAGKVKQSQIDNAVRNVLRVKYRLGLFENPYIDLSLRDSVMYAPTHLAAAKKAATESAVLLKNDKQVLPLSQNVKRVAVVGPMADAPQDQLGTWTFDGEKEKTITPLAALRQLEGVTVNYAPGVAYSRDRRTDGIAKAVAAARQSDVVLAFLGEEAILSGEAHSLADLNLQGAQRQLVAELAKTGKPLVLVVMAGRPLTIGDEVDKADAVMYMFHPGTMGGPAIADLLWGAANPSGKLPVTFPKMVGQVPVYYAHNNTGRPAYGTETLLHDIPLEAAQTSLGNTSYHLDAGFHPLFPFGYGLSYTTFEYGQPQLSASTLGEKDTLTVECQLTNTGRYEGTEVAQLYVRDHHGSVARPVKELKRFQRVSLQPGETKTVTFELPVEDLAFYGADLTKKVEPGQFSLWVSGDSQSGQPTAFAVE